jgi:hypothetical protein
MSEMRNLNSVRPLHGPVQDGFLPGDKANPDCDTHIVVELVQEKNGANRREGNGQISHQLGGLDQ